MLRESVKRKTNQPHKGREKYSLVQYGIGNIRMSYKNAKEIQAR